MSAISLPEGNNTAEMIRRLRAIDAELFGTLYAKAGIIGGDVEIRGTLSTNDIHSFTWDGAIPLVLPDVSATQGYALQSETGIGQFSELYATGEFLTELKGGEVIDGTIKTSKLVVGSFDNLVQDPGFETADTITNIHLPFDNGGSWGTGTSARSGGKSINYNGTGQTSNAAVYLNGAGGDINNHPAVAVADEIYMSAWCRGFSSGPWNDTQVVISWRDEDGSSVGGSSSSKLTVTASWQKLVVSGTAPSGAAYCVLQLWVYNDGNNELVLFDDCYARRMIGYGLIEADSITATEINVTSLDAITANMGTLTVDNTLTMATGGVFRTATSGTRLEIKRTDLDRVTFYTGHANEDDAGYISSALDGSNVGLLIQSPAPIFGAASSITLYGPNQIRFDGLMWPVNDGSAGAPIYSFFNDTNTGMYLGSGDRIEFGAGGNRRFSISPAFCVFGPFTTGYGEIKTNAAGTEAKPTYVFVSDDDTGLYRYGTNQLGWATNGTVAMRLGTTTFYVETKIIDFRFRGIDSFPTTGVSPNLHSTTGSDKGRVYRYTSARKYKSRINYNVDYLADIELKPTKHYRKDDGRWFYSFIADDLADEDTLLGVYDAKDEIERFDISAVMAVMAAKINRLERQVKELVG